MELLCEGVSHAGRIVAALLVACLVGCAGKGPDLPAGNVETVDIRLDDWGQNQKAAKVSSTDAAKVRALLAVLRSAKPTEDHKCGDSGKLTLRQKGGGAVEIGILAGHDLRFYEFRVYRGESYEIFRVERAPFLKAMAAFRVGELDPGRGK